MTKKINFPRLRFKKEDGTDFPAWEQRKLGELASEQRGGGTPSTNNPSFWQGEIPWIQSSDLREDDFFHINLRKRINAHAIESSAAKLVPANSIAIVTRVGVGKLAVCPFQFATSQDFLSLSGLKIDINFAAYSFAREIQKLKTQSQGTSIKGITKSELLNSMVLVPSPQEQAKIGDFFKIIDCTITLHQKKLEHLKKLKKSLLQNMFPRVGEIFPRLRFPEFTDAWEQRKLGDFGIVQMNRRIFKEQTSEKGDIPFFKIGTFGGEPDAFISRQLYEEYRKKYPFPRKGDLLISAAGSIGTVVEYQGEDAYFQDSNIVWLAHGDELANKFLKAFYNQVDWSHLEGSTIKRLYNKDLLDTPIAVPTLAEQKKVGNLFESLDSTITLHQRKLEKMQLLKKALLQQMFV